MNALLVTNHLPYIVYEPIDSNLYYDPPAQLCPSYSLSSKALPLGLTYPLNLSEGSPQGLNEIGTKDGFGGKFELFSSGLKDYASCGKCCEIKLDSMQ